MHSNLFLLAYRAKRIFSVKFVLTAFALIVLLLVATRIPHIDFAATTATAEGEVESVSTVTSSLTVPIELSKQTTSARLITSDSRAAVLDEYFLRNNSPLYGLGDVFAAACDNYNAPQDCTTVAAIAYVETGLCTYLPSQAQKNCWGFGGSGENRINFTSYNEAINYVTSKLVSGYGHKYMTNPELMEDTYCGVNCNSWGEGVQGQRNVINALASEMGYNKLF